MQLTHQETICLKCQSLFSEENNKSIIKMSSAAINLSSAEFAKIVVKDNMMYKRDLRLETYVICQNKSCASNDVSNGHVKNFVSTICSSCF